MPLVHRLVTFIASFMIAVNLELIHDLWVPNIFIYNLKTFQVIDVLSKLAGLWINNKKEVYYRFVLLLDIHVHCMQDGVPLSFQPSHTHHLHLSHALRLFPAGYASLQVPGER